MNLYLISISFKGKPSVQETKRFNSDKEALAYAQGIENAVSLAVYKYSPYPKRIG